ncbi:exo-alpha-sialidase [Kribbella albertanoniae]|uniref:exo-alpha-sialidase n=1 Tax=Kribbella albertanoniae TaxID=1266829 RepID=A0A4R4Q501_9ACTN|nr:sialidase family protein [Kribbella albertanoniae]TDC29962.1 laminin G [Kribbella albertanoniae]
MYRRVLMAVILIASVGLAPVATRQAEAAISGTTVFEGGVGGYACYRVPAIVRTTKGTLLAFAEGRQGNCLDNGDHNLVLRRSTDNGRTWVPAVTQAPIRVASGIPGGDKHAPTTWGNPVPIVDQESERIVLLSRYSPEISDGDPTTPGPPRLPYLQISIDDGLEWSTPRNLSSEVGQGMPGPGHGIQLADGPAATRGRLVAPMWFGGFHRTALVYSDDGGLTWARGAESPAGADRMAGEPNAVERANGQIYVLARDNKADYPGTSEPYDGRDKVYAVSSDGGLTFDAEFKKLPNLESPVVQSAVLRLRSTAHGDKYNRILLSSPSVNARERMMIRSSFDEGVNYQDTSGGTLIYSGPSGYSDLVEANSGQIGMLYERGVSKYYESIRYASFTEADLGLPDSYTGGVATPDLSGHGNTSRIRGGATTVAGRFGQAVRLDGTDDYVQVPFAESMAVNAGDFTLAAWVKYSATTGNHPIFWAYNVGENFSQVWLRAEPEGNRVRGFISHQNKTAVVQTSNAYNDGQWHHVVLKRAEGVLSLSVDGVTNPNVAAAPAGSVSPGRPFHVHIGRRLDGGQHFAGALDEVRLYTRALSDTELKSIRIDNAANIPDAILRLPLEPQ